MPITIDVFCRVIDHFGDAGVTARLVRQLAQEYGYALRLWIDKPDTLHALRIDFLSSVQVCALADMADDICPAQWVIETFSGGVPACYEAAMARQLCAPVWINLEYLSAEAWVEGCHLLPSPHPQLPLTRYFFFPGFTAQTGGLLREADLITRRDQFLSHPQYKQQWLQAHHLHVVPPATQEISLFCYPHTQLATWLRVLSHAETATHIRVPQGVIMPDLMAAVAQPLRVGHLYQQGRLSIEIIPLLEQAEYDYLLWSSDCNIVRGEDSFVRAQWAGKPLLWHIYPQQEAAHIPKLTAFIDRYLYSASTTLEQPYRALSLAFNTAQPFAQLWSQYVFMYKAYLQHAQKWCRTQILQPDCTSQLVHFFKDQLK